MNDVPHHCIGDCRRAEQRIRELETQLEEMKYERDHWKREAGHLAESECADAIQTTFALSPTESVICAALYRRRDRMLARSAIEGLLDDLAGESVGSSMVSVMVGKIRTKLGIGDEAIENQRGRGYRLSTEALALLDKRLPAACR